MPKVIIPKVGSVNFPDSMSTEDVRKHAGRLHRIANVSERTGSVDVTRSLPFAKKAIAAGNNSPALAHFVSKAEHLPSGRDHVDFATGRHALKATAGSGKDFNQAEFHRLLHEDLAEATARAGTRSDWMEVDKPDHNQAGSPRISNVSKASIITALQQIAGGR
jgi:hypothetical protein